MALKDLKDKICIVGAGDTPQGEFPDKNGDDQAVDAFTAALKDAGLKKQDIDGLYVHPSFGGLGVYETIGQKLGIDPKVGGDVPGHGSTGCYQIQASAFQLDAGMANYVAVVYGTNQKTNRNRFGGSAANFLTVNGIYNPSWMPAHSYRRYMYLYGTTEADLGQIAVHQRKYAGMNPKAVQKTPITIQDYLDSRYIVYPLHMYDYCYITDGGHCFIMTTAERARDMKKPPVYISGWGRNEVFTNYESPDFIRQANLQKPVAAEVYGMSGMKPKDMDGLYVQDAYTPAVISALENYGFCKDGEALQWMQNGGMEIGGKMPVNINGGQTSETYMEGWHNIIDAVRQLRHEAKNEKRQIPNAEVIQCTFTGGICVHSSSLILRR